jgi:hypothetical protein
MTRYLRSRPTVGSLLCFVSRIPWDSTQKGWTAGSAIRRLVGKEKACGLPTALELLFTRKVVRERRARSYISSFAPTRSRSRHWRATNALVRQRVGKMSSTTIHWGRILLGGLLAEVALILAIIPLGLRLGDNFLHYTAPPGSFIMCFLGALGVPADRIPLHSAWDVRGSRRGADLRCLDARPA